MNAPICPLFWRTLIVGLLGLAPGSLRADHDFLQSYFALPRNFEFRVHDSGSEGLTGLNVIRALGPYRAVPYIDRSLRLLDKSSFGDGGRNILTLRDLNDPASIPILLDVALKEDTAEAAELLGRLKATQAIPRLGALLDHSDYNIRAKALRGLVLMESARAAAPLIRHGQRILPLVDSPYSGHGAFLTDLLPALGRIGHRDAVPFLRQVLGYTFPFDDRTRTHHKNAALALAMLGDRSQLQAIVAIDREYDAVRILRHPVALERARAIVRDPDLGEEELDQGIVVELGGARLVAALRIFAEMGTPADIDFLRQRRATLRKLRMDVVTGEEPPFGFGNYIVENRNVPVLFDWALAAAGEAAALSRLEAFLQHTDPVVVAEAARALVLLRKKSFYLEIANRFRAVFARKQADCKDFERRYGQYDRAVHARKGMVRELSGHFGGEQSSAGLALLVAILNDCNVHVIAEARLALKRYPPGQVIPVLIRAFMAAGEQESFQLATMLELLGQPGLKALAEVADMDGADWPGAVARRALIRAEFGAWQKYPCPAGTTAAEKDLREWIAYRFQYHRPEISKFQSCR